MFWNLRKEEVKPVVARQFQAPALKTVETAITRAELLDALCEEMGASYEIERGGDNVVVKLLLPDGDVLTGTGPNTDVACKALVKKIKGEV